LGLWKTNDQENVTNSAAGIVLIQRKTTPSGGSHVPLSCPQCTLPETVIDRFILGTTTGERIEHVRISCPASHHFSRRSTGLLSPIHSPKQRQL
jgi:hypothetical protein